MEFIFIKVLFIQNAILRSGRVQICTDPHQTPVSNVRCAMCMFLYELHSELSGSACYLCYTTLKVTVSSLLSLVPIHN